MAGVTADTPATVLCDGDAGLWRLQREALPNAITVLDWWLAAVRFDHALQAARGLGAADAHLPPRFCRKFPEWLSQAASERGSLLRERVEFLRRAQHPCRAHLTFTDHLHDLALRQSWCRRTCDSGIIRIRNDSVLARPYIDRLSIFKRLIWPSVWPLLHGSAIAFFTASLSRLSVLAKRCNA
jgi:hypothetical protein